MNSKFLKAVLASAAVAVASFGSTGALAATGTANANANILAPVTLTRTAHLEFGNIAATANGNVTVPAVGARTCGGLVCNGTWNAAAFTVTGDVGQTVGISIPITTATLRDGGGVGPNSIPLSGLASDVPSIVLDGSDAFTVGGQIAVVAGQASGVYTASFSVDVNYQ